MDTAGDGAVAFGDESIRGRGDSAVYLVAAVTLPEWTFADDQALRRLVPKGSAKLHWYELVRPLRELAADAVAGMSRPVTAIARVPMRGVSQKRARNLCLRALLRHLEARGVGTLVLESRTGRQDAEDRALAAGLRSAGAVGGISVEHEYGSRDSRLWVPDVVLGAYGGGRGELWGRFGGADVVDAVR